MNASKENAEEALRKLAQLSDSMSSLERTTVAGLIIFLEGFLEAAKRRLPREESFPKKPLECQQNKSTKGG